MNLGQLSPEQLQRAARMTSELTECPLKECLRIGSVATAFMLAVQQVLSDDAAAERKIVLSTELAAGASRNGHLGRNGG